eukprot:superscaffoldBa00003521_g17127
MSLICGMTMMMRRRRVEVQDHGSGSATLPSDPSLRSQRPPAALSTSKNSSKPRSRAKDEDEDGFLTRAGKKKKTGTQSLKKLQNYQKELDVTF